MSNHLRLQWEGKLNYLESQDCSPTPCSVLVGREAQPEQAEARAGKSQRAKTGGTGRAGHRARQDEGTHGLTVPQGSLQPPRPWFCPSLSYGDLRLPHTELPEGLAGTELCACPALTAAPPAPVPPSGTRHGAPPPAPQQALCRAGTEGSGSFQPGKRQEQAFSIRCSFSNSGRRKKTKGTRGAGQEEPARLDRVSSDVL